jgi:DnaJ-class molecular chaperone
LACLIEETVLKNYGTQGLDLLRRKVGAGRTADEVCGHCCGTGRMVRDQDIGTDQECFVCEGSGTVHNDEANRHE